MHKSGEMQGNVSLERALEYFSEKKRPREFANGRRNEIRGAYHLTENFGNSGWKVNGKVTFRKFQPKIEEYVLR